MKKLIMAVAIVCAAACAQASAVAWGLTSSSSVDAEMFASGTAYLICVTDVAKPAVFADDAAAQAWFKDNGASLSSKALLSGTIEGGKFSAIDQLDEAIGRKNYWLAFVNADETALAVSTTTKAFNITTSTLQITGQWDGATQMKSYGLSVPEPTSGLLLLLGMAGLALKRKRA